MKEKPTKVIFRVFKRGGDVIALFPQLPGTRGLNTCLSYQRVGQHGAASIYIMSGSETRAAMPEEYAPLARELESLGYILQIKKRCTYSDWRTRKAAL